jgi:hypothetical protein
MSIESKNNKSNLRLKTKYSLLKIQNSTLKTLNFKFTVVQFAIAGYYRHSMATE